jgi:hypothetical protein
MIETGAELDAGVKTNEANVVRNRNNREPIGGSEKR